MDHWEKKYDELNDIPEGMQDFYRYKAIQHSPPESQAEIARLTAEVERLTKAWEAKHKTYIKEAKDSAEYFDKSQRRMHELVSERNTARNDALNSVISLIADSDIPREEAKKLVSAIRAMKEGE